MSQGSMSACMDRLRPWIIKTPLVFSEILSDRLGTGVYLKLESLQKTGAFKFRGAMNYLLSLSDEERARGVVTASSGNHGLGMSLGSKLLGLNCTVVMPAHAPLVKQERAKEYGATVVLHGDSYDDAAAHAKRYAADRGAAYVPSFNNAHIMEGQGTIMAEVAEQLPDADCVLAPVGGGGLIAGLLLARDELGMSSEVIGVEPRGAASMKASLDAGRLVTLPRLDTIADGVAVKTVGDLTYAVVAERTPSVVIVSDESIRTMQRALLTQAKILAEPAGAVALAGLAELIKERRPKKAVCIVTGANVDQVGLQKLFAG